MEDYKYLFKIVLIGNAGVGKTCLVRRFIQGDFPIGLGATIGVDFMIKPMVVNGKCAGEDEGGKYTVRAFDPIQSDPIHLPPGQIN